MSSVRWPDHLLTLDEWDALGDDDAYRWAELVEGVLQVSPSPTTRHQVASLALTMQLTAALADTTYRLINNVDVVLRSTNPPTVRQPDVLVVPSEALDGFPRRLSAVDVVVAIEIVSPGSRRIDRVVKVADYADAGIPNYWIVELDGEVTLDTFERVGSRYEPVLQGATGAVDLVRPVPLTLDLDALVP